MNWDIFNKKPKGKSGLYKELDFIINSCSKGCATKFYKKDGLNIYNHEDESLSLCRVDQENKYALRKLDENYIEIEFESYFHNSHTRSGKGGQHFVFFVSEDDNIHCSYYNQVKNDIHNVLSFLENKGYKIACESSNKRKEKENIINSPINKMAKEILLKLGYKYTIDDFYDLGISYGKRYNYDQLYIDSSSLSCEKIHIGYMGNPVFNSNNGIIRSGSWERLLLEIYNHIDELEAQERNIISNKKDGYEYFQKIYKKLPKPSAQWKVGTTYAARSINNVARLRTKLSEYEASNGCGYDKYYTYEVWKYDKMSDDVICVLSVSKKDDFSPKYSECAVNKFIPGVWQEELLYFFQNEDLIKEHERSNAEEESVEKSIRKLRK